MWGDSVAGPGFVRHGHGHANASVQQPMRLLRRTLAVSVLGAVCFLVPLGTSSGAVRDGTSSAHMAVAQQQCSDSRYSGTRDPANPLELSPAPGSDPLSGAHLF